MKWNYRIHERLYPCAVSDVSYELHETFYDDKGTPIMWTEEPEAGPCESPDELIEMLEMMLSDAKKSRDDILDYHAPQPELEND